MTDTHNEDRPGDATEDVEETYTADGSASPTTSIRAPPTRRSAGDHRRRGHRPSQQAVAGVASSPAPASRGINGRTLDSYFPTLHQQVGQQPFATTTRQPLRRHRRIARRRHHRPGRRAAPGCGPMPELHRHRRQPRRSSRRPALLTATPRHRAQEGRSEEGPRRRLSTASADRESRRTPWLACSARDGVRGLANGDLTAAPGPGPVRGRRSCARRPRRVRGTAAGLPSAVDDRVSGKFLEAAVVAGLRVAGVDVLLLGVLPTPASPTSPTASAPTSASCCPPRTTRCPTTASSSSPRGGRSRRRDRQRHRAPPRRAVRPPDRRQRRHG